MNIFSERLRELREQKKLSMLQLAKKIGVSDAAICKWENSITEPKLNYIKLLAEYFEVSTDYLMGLENDIGIKKYFPPQKENPADTFSAEEKELIEDYRALSPALQEMLQATIRTWKGTTANSKNKKKA